MNRGIFLLFFSFLTLVTHGQTIKISFEYINGFMYVNATIGENKPIKLIYDTGSSTTLLDSTKLKQSGFDITNTFKTTVGGFGSKRIPILQMNNSLDLSFQDHKRNLKEILLTNMDSLLPSLNCDGILGIEAFSDRVIRIN